MAKLRRFETIASMGKDETIDAFLKRRDKLLAEEKALKAKIRLNLKQLKAIKAGNPRNHDWEDREIAALESQLKSIK